MKPFFRTLSVLLITGLTIACAGRNEKAIPVAISDAVVFTPESAEAKELAAYNPLFTKLFDYLQTHRLDTMQAGRYEIDGDRLFLMLNINELKAQEDAPLEVHDRYYDLQIALRIDETFGLSRRSACKAPRGEMNTEADILFFDDQPERYVTLRPGEAILLSPEMAHAPLIGEGEQFKAVFKILRE
ncbi:MAG: YhcH/YjgK/YiaL family protein [Alistipes sp.]|nr:YhcH/YjgK/YiaL family protein [Alistipes sp.]